MSENSQLSQKRLQQMGSTKAKAPGYKKGGFIEKEKSVGGEKAMKKGKLPSKFGK